MGLYGGKWNRKNWKNNIIRNKNQVLIYKAVIIALWIWLTNFTIQILVSIFLIISVFFIQFVNNNLQNYMILYDFLILFKIFEHFKTFSGKITIIISFLTRCFVHYFIIFQNYWNQSLDLNSVKHLN